MSAAVVKRVSFAVGLTVFVLLPSLVVHANEDQFFVGNEAAMVGGSVVATVDDGSALYYNPAGLGNIERDSIDVSASAYTVRFYRVADYIRVPSGQSEDAASTEFITLPTQIAYTRRLSDDLVLGLGYFAPRGGDLLLQERFEFSSPAGSTSVAYDSRESTQEFYLSAGIGAEISKRFRLGISLHGTYESATLSGAAFLGVTNEGVTDKALLFSQLFTSDRIGLEVGAGLQFDVTRELTLAASLRSPRFHVSESQRSSNDLLVGSRFESMDPVFYGSSDPVEETGEFRGLLTYGRYHVGASYRMSSTLVRAEVDLQPGFSDTDLNVERSFAWNVRAGVTHQLTGAVMLGMGAFTDQRTSPGDTSFYGGTLGVELSNEHLLAAGESADSLVFSSVFAFRYAYGTGDNEFLVVDPEAQVTNLFLVGMAKGSLVTHEIGLHVGSSLKF